MSQAEKEKLDKVVEPEASENAGWEKAEAPEAPEVPETPEAPEAPETSEAPAAEAISVEEALQREVAQLKDQLLRKEADFQNYRRRMAREVSDSRRVGMVETITPFLQLFDLFDMAMKAADKSDNVAALKQGLEMILAQYDKAIDELGVQKFDAIGATFDPQWHDAVAYENNEAAEGVIIKQWNCGYKMGDKLLRPARVIVSSGAAKAEDAAENSDSESSDKE